MAVACRHGSAFLCAMAVADMQACIASANCRCLALLRRNEAVDPPQTQTLIRRRMPVDAQCALLTTRACRHCKIFPFIYRSLVFAVSLGFLLLRRTVRRRVAGRSGFGITFRLGDMTARETDMRKRQPTEECQMHSLLVVGNRIASAVAGYGFSVS